MSLLPRPPRALLRFDEITYTPPAASADVEGIPSLSATTVFVGRGTISIATQQDLMLAAQRGTRVDKILSLELGLDVQAGGLVLAKGISYEVVGVDDRRLFRRATMRKAS